MAGMIGMETLILQLVAPDNSLTKAKGLNK